MKCLLLVGLLCVVLVIADKSNDDKVLCKRIMCEDDDICAQYAIDDRGCPTCTCTKIDECKPIACKENEICVPEPEPRCQPCPLPDCMNDCPYGFKTQNGCQTCECKSEPCEGVKCKEGQECRPFHSCGPDQKCDMEPRCIDSDVEILPPQSGDMPCPMPECMTACEFGYRNNKRGCMTCECNTEPCEGHRCPEGSECISRETECPGPDCPVEAHCIVTPMCKKMKQVSENGLECDESGTFKPLQCEIHDKETKECWCVNDRGDETEGTRAVVKDGSNPDCFYNRTLSVHVTFLLKHDIDVVETHLGKIKEVVHHHIVEWLLVDRRYIINLKVEPHTHKVKILVVEFEVVKYGQVDLAATAVHLQNHMKHGRCHVLYDGHKLHADPDTLHVEHRFGPETADGLRFDDRNRRCWLRWPVLIAAPVGALFLVAVVVMIIVVNRKRVQRIKRQRLVEEGDTFQKNLQFSNELYDQTNITDGDIKKVKLEFTTEANTAEA